MVRSLMWKNWKSISKIQTGEACLEGFWCDRMVFGPILSFWSPIWEIFRGARTSKSNEIELDSHEIQESFQKPSYRTRNFPNMPPLSGFSISTSIFFQVIYKPRHHWRQEIWSTGRSFWCLKSSKNDGIDLKTILSHQKPSKHTSSIWICDIDC